MKYTNTLNSWYQMAPMATGNSADTSNRWEYIQKTSCVGNVANKREKPAMISSTLRRLMFNAPDLLELYGRTTVGKEHGIIFKKLSGFTKDMGFDGMRGIVNEGCIISCLEITSASRPDIKIIMCREVIESYQLNDKIVDRCPSVT